MIFYTSDPHLGHKNSIRFDKKPWNNVEDMNEGQIARWNGKISEEDTVYMMGDISWYKGKKTYELIKRLNGKKILVRGNHDYDYSPEFLALFEKVVEYGCEIKDGDRNVVLSHYPILFYKNQRYGWIHLYGHLHIGMDHELCERLKQEIRDAGIPCRAYNVGCMLWDFVPVTLDEILYREEENAKI